MFANYPFLMLSLAGFLAGVSAILLRRATSVFGRRLGLLSLAAGVGSAAAFGAAFYWAAMTPPTGVPSKAETFGGIALALAGSVLAGWALRVRGIGVLDRWRPERFERRQPYRSIRRPVELGLMACATGLCWLRPAAPVWVWLAAWIVPWNVMLELGDWELRRRLPACRDYLKRTPRYLPRFRRAGPRTAEAA